MGDWTAPLRLHLRSRNRAGKLRFRSLGDGAARYSDAEENQAEREGEMRRFGTKTGKKKGKQRQQSRKVVFRPNFEKTYHTMDLALADNPDTTEDDWLVAGSTLEYNRFCFLLECMAKGEIENLYFQPRFTVFPAVKLPKNAFRPKATIQRAIVYTPDAGYLYKGIYVLEDTKAKNKKTGEAIVQEAAPNRHKLLRAQLLEKYGANAHFKIVTEARAPLDEP